MNAVILSPAFRSAPRIHYEAMEMLRQNLGPVLGRDVIERTVGEISDRMASLQRALADGDLEQVRTIALRLTGISRQIGLVGFSDVAVDLVRCIDRQDPTATGAVAARLIRLGESSTVQAWQFAELGGA